MSAELIHIASSEHLPLADFNLVGRGVDATIRLDDASVSRQHASIRRQGSTYWVTDLGSSNLTYLNGLVIRSAQKLTDGDKLRFGSVEFEFLSDDPGNIDFSDTTLLQTQVLTRAAPMVQSKPVVMLVGDLKAYSELSARLPANELAQLMNHWYEDCRELFKEAGAVIDKFIGDCVFAYWHSDGPLARQQALECSLALSDASGRLTEAERQTLTDNNASFDCCVGLHVGEVALGGSSQSDYTVLGDAVNLAFRIEALTRNLEKDILASAEFVSGWEPVGGRFEPSGTHPVKGFVDPVEVYSAHAV